MLMRTYPPKQCKILPHDVLIKNMDWDTSIINLTAAEHAEYAEYVEWPE